MGTARKVLLVEDDPDLRLKIVSVLRDKGYEVSAVADAVGVEEATARGLPDLLVTEMMLPGRSGFQVLRLVAERSDWRVPAIMMSAIASTAPKDYALASGADAFLAKPFALAELVGAAEELCPAQPRTAARELTPAAYVGS